MSVPLAYLAVIVIWSTTPLAIQWSSQGTGYAFAVLARMLIGLAVAAVIIALWRIDFPHHARARRAYLVSGLGLFGAMALTYWSARLLPSGLVSVLFGLSPLMTGVLSALVLGERAMTPAKVVGTLLGSAGLAIIFLHGDALGSAASGAGLLGLLAAVAIYSGSLIWLKRIGDDSPPLATTAGSLAVSLPFFLLLWWCSDAQLPVAPPSRSVGAIVYLGVFGSVIGFALYYYMIKHLAASSVALVTLITPVLALLLGQLLNGESIAPRVAFGTAVILLGLLSHQADSLRLLLRQRLA